MSRISHPDIHRAAALVAIALSPFSLVAIAARLLAAIGTWRRIDGALGNRNSSLGLDLRHDFGGVLRQGRRHDWRWERGYLHGATRLTSTTITRFWHGLDENSVNRSLNRKEVNAILNKNAEIGSLQGLSVEQVQS